MSMISELVNKLRNEAQEVRLCNNECESAKLLERAADTIEMLSEKARESKQGEWIDVWQDGVCSWRGTCSNCRSTNDIPPPMLAKYCPSCGARMI